MQRVAAAMAGLAVVVAAPGIATANPPDRTEHKSSTGPRAQTAAPPPHAQGPKTDDLPNPLAEKQRALRRRGHQLLLQGKAQASDRGGDSVVQVAKGQYVELAREDEDSIWTVTAQFGDEAATHDGFTHEGPAGPAHNEIPKPDRSVDNTTIWTEDFSEKYYENLLFSEEPGAISMRNFYLEQSSGRYTVNGDVTDWVTVPYNATSYGSDDCDHDGDGTGDNEADDADSIVCRDTWLFVDHSVDEWYQSQLDAGKTAAEIDQYLSQYDVWDRYDHDGDGNFDEPDGYIDHFQSVHAGVGQETGGGEQGSDAIWSHRWYVQLTGIGEGGPTLDDGTTVPFGGTQIGESDYWIGDYTIEPENGGVGVFAHEFAHDLGLPDLYDTSGNTGGAENSTAFWTLMSSGSYGSSGRPEDGIGSKPMHMGAWEKFQLGWLNYEVARAGQESAHRLGPAETNTRQAQGVFVLLPNKKVPLDLGAPYAGERFYYSGSGDELDNSMTKQVTVPGSDPTLTAQVRYDIESDWDYAYLTVDGQSVPTNLSTTDDPNGQNFGHGITGSSGGDWVELTADLSEYAGKTVDVGFRYWTDGAVAEPGFQADSVALGGTPIGTAEGDGGWTFDGFRTTTGSEVQEFFNAYVLANRQYRGFDKSLKTGPYNFGYLNTKPNWVEHFSYQDGLLVSYWDASYKDNNVGDHPGGGLILPVDAHPKLEHWADGTLMRPRLQAYDSTFGLEPTQEYTLHKDGVPSTIESQPAVPLFDDTKSYWTSEDEHGVTGSHPGHYQPGWNGVDVPETGTTVRVVSESAQDSFMQVIVNEGQ